MSQEQKQELVGPNDQFSAVKMSSDVVPSSGCGGMKTQSGGAKSHKKRSHKKRSHKKSQKKRSRRQRGGYGAQGFGGSGVPRFGYVGGQDVSPFAGSYPPMTAGSTGECPDAAKGVAPEAQKAGEGVAKEGPKQVGGGRKRGGRGRKSHNRKRSRHQKRGRGSRRGRTARKSRRKSRRNRRQRGGYHQYLSNRGHSAGYTFSGKNPVGMQMERVRYMTSDGQDNYNHFTGKSKASPVLDGAAN